METKAKIIDILDYQSGTIKETELDMRETVPAAPIGDLFQHKDGRHMSLEEAAVVTTSEFPTLLRDGIRPIMFDSYAGVTPTWNSWVREYPSNKPQEDYLEGSHVGLLSLVGEGAQYPRADLALDRPVTVVNQKRGNIFSITREMVMFDRVNMINQMVADFGRAAAMTIEQDCYNVLTTAGNYVRNSTTADNDIGANTAATTFGGLGLETAISTLVTMKDRKSGRYLGVRPSALICGPRLEWAAKMLLLSDTLVRQGGNTTNDVYGTGQNNPWRGLINQIIVSPFVQSYAWVLCEPKQFIYKQTVWDVELIEASAVGNNWNYLNFDALDYRVGTMYGVGMVNDRFAYYSSSSTAPIAN